MNIRKEIKKILCMLLVIIFSFILMMNQQKIYSFSPESQGGISHYVYAGVTDFPELNPIVLEPTDNQYVELNAMKLEKLGTNNYKITAELWLHGMETTGFDLRLSYDKDVIKPVGFEDNMASDDIEKIFQYEDGIAEHVDIFSFYDNEEENRLRIIGAVLDASDSGDTGNENIIISNEIGKKVINSVNKPVKLGKICFNSTTRDLTEDSIKVVADEKLVPTTGIRVLKDGVNYYEAQKMFHFTLNLISTNARLESLKDSFEKIEDFDPDTLKYTIEVGALEKEITLYPVPEDEKATIEIEGAELVEDGKGYKVKLNEMSGLSSSTQIKIVVTAEDGTTTMTYRVIVKKQGGFLQGTVLTENPNGIHHAKIKVYQADEIDWVNVNSPEIDEDKIVAQADTEDDGMYVIILPLGRYDILIDKPGYLDYIVKGVTIRQQETTTDSRLSNTQIYAGDINKDGRINIEDKSYLIAIYGSKEGGKDGLYDIKSDFSEDGRINIEDKSFIIANYGMTKKKTSIK